jgi:hypothetical protein
VHYSSNFWSKILVKAGGLNWFRPWRSRAAPTPAFARRPRRGRAGPARRGRPQSTVPRAVGPPLAPHRLPPPLTLRHAPRGRARQPCRRRPLASLPYPPHIAAVTAPILLLGLHIGDHKPPCKRRPPIKGSKPVPPASRAGPAAGTTNADVELHLPTPITTA